MGKELKSEQKQVSLAKGLHYIVRADIIASDGALAFLRTHPPCGDQLAKIRVTTALLSE
jgi:hypothetical protein